MILPPLDPRWAHVSSPPPHPVDWHLWRKFPKTSVLNDIAVSARTWIEARDAGRVLFGGDDFDGHVIDADDPLVGRLRLSPAFRASNGAVFVDLDDLAPDLFAHLLAEES